MPLRLRQRKRLRRRMFEELIRAQENEVTESVIYSDLAGIIEDKHNKEVLQLISKEEKKHADIWRTYTNRDIRPRRHKVLFYKFIATILGFTFAVKLMEKGEETAQVNYSELAQEIPQAQLIKQEEKEHEHQLLNMLDEEKLKYVGSMVLGVNDALVELTGALAGLTLALQNGSLIALTGLITGIAASFSMGASEYLSIKSEGGSKNPLKAATYTGLMYIVTVLCLIAPYFLVQNIYIALGITLCIAVIIIFLFTFYISIAQDLPFQKRFLEMVGISLSVSALTFFIGYAARFFISVDL